MQDDDNSHYCWIKKFSAFVRHSTEKSQGKMEHCRYCLQRFGSTFKGKTAAKKMEEHLAMGCRQISDVKPIMPKAEESTVEFNNIEKQYRAPFVIYADFEALTEPIDKVSRNPENSYTDAYQKHTPCGYCIQIVCSADASHSKSRTYKPIVYGPTDPDYIGTDTIPHFIKKIHELEEKIMEDLKEVEPMVMTEQDEIDHAAATECCLCRNP